MAGLRLTRESSLDGTLHDWIDVGQPDDRRLVRACGRADRVLLMAYAASVPVWWQGIASKLTRLRNLQVWQVPAAQAQALAALAQRSMQLQISVQDGTVYVVRGEETAELTPVRLYPAA